MRGLVQVGVLFGLLAVDIVLWFGVVAEGFLAGAAGLFCPAGRAFFLSLNKKKQKVNTGAAPLCTR